MVTAQVHGFIVSLRPGCIMVVTHTGGKDPSTIICGWNTRRRHGPSIWVSEIFNQKLRTKDSLAHLDSPPWPLGSAIAPCRRPLPMLVPDLGFKSEARTVPMVTRRHQAKESTANVTIMMDKILLLEYWSLLRMKVIICCPVSQDSAKAKLILKSNKQGADYVWLGPHHPQFP